MQIKARGREGVHGSNRKASQINSTANQSHNTTGTTYFLLEKARFKSITVKNFAEQCYLDEHY